MEDGVAFEMLDDGTLQERNMGMESDEISSAFAEHLREFVVPRKLGVVFGQGTGLQIFPGRPNRIPRADAGFISAGRLPSGRSFRGHLVVVPELLVEVVSPNDTVDEVEAKAAEYLALGVSVVWVVKPGSRSVDVWRADGSVTRLTGDEEVAGDAFLPGFAVKVSAFFP